MWTNEDFENYYNDTLGDTLDTMLSNAMDKDPQLQARYNEWVEEHKEVVEAIKETKTQSEQKKD